MPPWVSSDKIIQLAKSCQSKTFLNFFSRFAWTYWVIKLSVSLFSNLSHFLSFDNAAEQLSEGVQKAKRYIDLKQPMWIQFGKVNAKATLIKNSSENKHKRVIDVNSAMFKGYWCGAEHVVFPSFREAENRIYIPTRFFLSDETREKSGAKTC